MSKARNDTHYKLYHSAFCLNQKLFNFNNIFNIFKYGFAYILCHFLTVQKNTSNLKTI